MRDFTGNQVDFTIVKIVIFKIFSTLHMVANSICHLQWKGLKEKKMHSMQHNHGTS